MLSPPDLANCCPTVLKIVYSADICEKILPGIILALIQVTGKWFWDLKMYFQVLTDNETLMFRSPDEQDIMYWMYRMKSRQRHQYAMVALSDADLRAARSQIKVIDLFRSNDYGTEHVADSKPATKMLLPVMPDTFPDWYSEIVFRPLAGMSLDQ